MPIGQSGALPGRPRVRSATAEDLVQLPALEAASDTLLEGLIGPDPNGSLTHAGALPPPASVAELASACGILVAGEPPAGFARIEEVDGQAHLEQLSVHPSAAGAGLGRLLVESALQWAREQGYRSMTLCTFAQIPFNAPFYRSCGFEEVPEPDGQLREVREHERLLGLDDMGPRVAMRRDLNPR
ncbi:GNAT family N-acetyltransferase [Arthrobacter sp. 08Y14]|uniref:GNAT family N-acetyltransferase n=1 Tax=Arthrobacter sp. 08Y14 TaxID=2058885 RepID=UPI000CE369D3|nr:GNAT family N-acetyltransferase [Arthrobacter sp. 08Y14]